jgi:hypothetical protein
MREIMVLLLAISNGNDTFELSINSYEFKIRKMNCYRVIIMILMVLIQASTLLAQESQDPALKAKIDRQTKWLKFSGTRLNKGNDVVLTSSSGESFSIDKKALKTIGDSIFIKNKTLVKFQRNTLKNFNEEAGCKCPVKILATNREERIPKHGCDTKCYGVILACTTCVYNSVGVFIKEETKICGGCIGLPF